MKFWKIGENVLRLAMFPETYNIKWEGIENSKKLYEYVIGNNKLEWKESFFYARLKECQKGQWVNNDWQKMRLNPLGMEYLIDTENPINLRGKDKEEAFTKMPEELRDGFFYKLVKAQVKDYKSFIGGFNEAKKGVKKLEDEGQHFSINLEHNLTDDGLQKVLSLFSDLSDEEKKYISVEIKEDGVFSKEQFSILEKYAVEHNISFAIDDVGSGAHNFIKDRDKEVNLERLIYYLGRHIKFLKIDYSIIAKLQNPKNTNEDIPKIIDDVLSNLRLFIKKWDEKDGLKEIKPSVIIESMPFDLKKEEWFYIVLEKEIYKIFDREYERYNNNQHNKDLIIYQSEK